MSAHKACASPKVFLMTLNISISCLPTSLLDELFEKAQLF